ncbi:tRNA pseudouridine(13) synthase TruD [bacterium]|nr:tRNA pseudouridine(13) synthase TruD [bacterium]
MIPTFDERLLDLNIIGPRLYGELGLSTFDINGIGGCLKEYPEDFEVEEIPSYYPCGEGDHLFIWIEKKLLSSDELIQIVSSSLGISNRDIGIAGKKDRDAVTRQFISVPKSAMENIDALTHQNLKVISTELHKNKLSIGHHKGNRFKIKLRDLVDMDLDKIARISERIITNGFPNFFGIQRFGSKGDTAEIGFKLLNGDEKGLSKRWLNKTGRKFALSAAQSYLFNRYLLKRLIDKGWMTLLDGDVVYKTTGGIFRVEDVEAESQRYLQNEIVPAGPIFGKKTFASDKTALEFEDTILKEANIERAAFSSFGKMLPGARRAIICKPQDFSYSIEDNTLNLDFILPSGSYATVLLSEFIKPLVSDLLQKGISV